MWWWLACAAPNPPASSSPAPPSRPPMEAPAAPAQSSGALLQDPTGFPHFHSQPAPPGPSPNGPGAWSAPTRLSSDEGGLRPQIVAGADGTLHVVYYAQTAKGDLLRHRERPVSAPCTSKEPCAYSTWSDAESFGHASGRNWGPDLVVRDDGSVVVSYDHTEPSVSFAGLVSIVKWTHGHWLAPEIIRAEPNVEVGSAHVADAASKDLAVVWIERALRDGARFQAMSRWLLHGSWQPVAPLPSPAPAREAWHTNVERRLDGSVVAGWDLGPGGGENQVLYAIGKDGRWEQPVDASEGRYWGERPHFAFGVPHGEDDGVTAIWFHRVADRPLNIYERDPDGVVNELSRGVGGFQFDPDVAINAEGVRCAVWGWDAGAQAELVYSLNRGQGWSYPAEVASLGAKKPGLPSIAVTPDGAFHVVWAQWLRGDSAVWYAALPPPG